MRRDWIRTIEEEEEAEEVKVYATVKEWQDEAIRLFGNAPAKWAFECPVCHRVYTVLEHAKYRPENEGDVAYNSCIGRVNGKGKSAFRDPSKDSNAEGCDYCSYGLLRLGDMVIDEGKEYFVFPFAESEAKTR